ncbi:alpha/beta fold hydrolase [Propylenella binzhouense]|uniref:Alpha/beta fold hydrolase n=1 Tax=Propylenella binzhouense TaxID=2555902 RepID=A0A964WSL7_9HYPH|nr:alpha/beta fold hydrolase [Propylenella binzhouense]MYZ47104.1 alpha/beta fold hydrolase [Propylenella binzhouense]
MFIESNGVKFHCELAGPEGAPWITFSHALANNLTLWDDVAAKLSDRYRVLRYDHRGHGQTEAVPGPYTFPMLIEDVLGIWDKLGVDRSHWVGLSIGGMIGYGLGIEHPERLRTIVACDSRPDAPPDYAAYFQSRIDKAREKGMEGVVEPTIERWFTPETRAKNPPVLDKVRNMIRTTNPVGHEGCCEALKTLAFGPRLHEITVPTLILGGAKDKGAPPEALAEAAAKIPGAEHAVIPDAGHITALENPDAFMAVLEAFLAKH